METELSALGKTKAVTVDEVGSIDVRLVVRKQYNARQPD
jgi:hypothetical protein